MNVDLLVKMLKQEEGFRLDMYLDSRGIPSIGYGRNLRDVGIFKDEAELMLANDIRRTMADLDRAYPWWRTLDEVRQRVVCDMAFNMGVDRQSVPPGNLYQFVNTLRAIQEGRWTDAKSGMLKSQWAQQVGQRAIRLADMMEMGLEPQETP